MRGVVVVVVVVAVVVVAVVELVGRQIGAVSAVVVSSQPWSLSLS